TFGRFSPNGQLAPHRIADLFLWSAGGAAEDEQPRANHEHQRNQSRHGLHWGETGGAASGSQAAIGELTLPQACTAQRPLHTRFTLPAAFSIFGRNAAIVNHLACFTLLAWPCSPPQAVGDRRAESVFVRDCREDDVAAQFVSPP